MQNNNENQRPQNQQQRQPPTKAMKIAGFASELIKYISNSPQNLEIPDEIIVDKAINRATLLVEKLDTLFDKEHAELAQRVKKMNADLTRVSKDFVDVPKNQMPTVQI